MSIIKMKRRIINILDYGAKSGADTDCTVPVQKALEEIRSMKEAVTLLFPKGEYHFYKEYSSQRVFHTSNTNSLDYPEKRIGILIENQDNLHIDGDGSLFLFHGNIMALAVVFSKNIELYNFSWDYPCATISEMMIEKIDHKSVTYKIPEAQTFEIKGKNVRWYEKSPFSNEVYWSFHNLEKVAALVLYQPQNKISIRCDKSIWPLMNVESVREVSGHRIEVRYKKMIPECYEPGMCFEICRNEYRETVGAFLWESEEIHMKGIKVHYMHGMGWLTQMCRNVSFYQCLFIPRENTGRRATSFADLIHVSGAAGDIRIEECKFSDSHDDPINIHGTFTRVKDMMDNHTLVLEYVHNQQGGFMQYHSGDKVVFYARDTLQEMDGAQEYTVDQTGSVMNEDGRSMSVSFVEELPLCLMDKIGIEGKYVAENVTYTPSVLIRKCTFEAVPTRGILCTTRKRVIIEKNEFYSMSLPSIYISNDSDDWYESGPVRDMEIQNNIFYIKNPYENPEGNPAICIHPIVKGGILPGEEYPIHKNIRIHNNTFYVEDDKILVAENVENLMFYDNKIIWYHHTDKNKSELIYLTACKNTYMNENTYDERKV